MKTNKFLLVASTLTLGIIQSNLANPGDANPLKVDELRAEYRATKLAYETTENPKLGDQGFQQKLRVWSEAKTHQRNASRALTRSHIKELSTLAPSEFKTARAELYEIHRYMVGTANVLKNQANHQELEYFAEVVLPEVRDKVLSEDSVELLVALTEPNTSVRNADKQIKKGAKSEPYGWVIQDVYALALARAEKFDLAREENDLLLKKVSVLLPSKFNTNHCGSIRTKESLYREFLIHRALIEALSGDNKAARKRLTEAKAIKETDAGILLIQKRIEKEILK